MYFVRFIKYINLSLIMILALGLVCDFIPQVSAWTDPALQFSPLHRTAEPGGTVTYEVQVQGTSSPGETVQLSATITPTAVICATFSFTPNNQPAPFTSTMTVYINPAKEPGDYTIIIRAISTLGIESGAGVSLEIVPPATPFDFTLGLSPPIVEIEQGETADYGFIITYSDPSYSGTVITIQNIMGLGSGMVHHLSISPPRLSITTSSTTPPGSYTFTVVGVAQGITRQTSGTIIVTTPTPSFDFSVSISPSTQTIGLKEKATYTVNVAVVSGAGETVALSTSGLPGDIQNSLSTASGTAPYSSTLTVDTATATSTGTFTITVTATGAGKTKTATATLTVKEEADFSITASPMSTEINQGDSATFTLTINEVGDYDQSVSLTATGLPSGATQSFNPTSGKPVFTSTLTIAITESTPTGSFTVMIDASGGGKTRSATVTLTVREKPQDTLPTTEVETTETTGAGSIISALLSNTTYLLVMVIAVLAITLGATALRRGRAPTTPQPRPQAPTGYCVNCGARLKPKATFCSSCGQRIE